jgi:hypothetical protein
VIAAIGFDLAVLSIHVMWPRPVGQRVVGPVSLRPFGVASRIPKIPMNSPALQPYAEYVWKSSLAWIFTAHVITRART